LPRCPPDHPKLLIVSRAKQMNKKLHGGDGFVFVGYQRNYLFGNYNNSHISTTRFVHNVNDMNIKKSCFYKIRSFRRALVSATAAFAWRQRRHLRRAAPGKTSS
jgi:hypothetical protein